MGLLAKYPDITAQRIFEELREAGYDGGYTAVKDRVRKLRPKPGPKPSLITPVTGPGEMAESDWSPYTVDLEGGGRITVQAFGYILRWSCRKYFGLFERCDLHALMDGHVAAFARFGGAATVWGPIVGAVVLTVAAEGLKAYLEQAHLFFYGLLLVLVVLFLPGGLVSISKQRWFRRAAGRAQAA